MTPHKLQKFLQKTLDLEQGGVPAIAREIVELDEKILTIPKGDKGDKGDVGLDGKDGIDGVNGVDGENGNDGKNGRDGKDGRDGRDGLNGRDGVDGKDGSPDARLQIVEKINTGKKKDLKIEAEQVSGLEKMHTDTLNRAISILDQRTQFLINKIPAPSGGLTSVAHDETLTGDGTSGNPLSVVASGGIGAWSTPSESPAPDGSVLVFTVGASAPTDVVSDGTNLFEGFGYTFSAGQITLDNGPTQFIRYR